MEQQDGDIYGLVGRLCESVLLRGRGDKDDEQPYPAQEERGRHLRRLRVRAYEILLNKSNRANVRDYKECDPIVELLKHVFVLKTEAGRFAQAAELQRYLDVFIDEGLEPDSGMYAALQFLNCLKSVETDDDKSLNVFYYDKPHPSLPEMYSEDGVTPYQIYPVESFHLPKKFEMMFSKEYDNFTRYNTAEPGTQLTLLGRFTPSLTNNSIDCNNDINLQLSNVSVHPNNLTKGMNLELNSYFFPQIKDISERSESNFQPCIEGIVTEPESPWQCQDPLQIFMRNNNLTEICEIEENESEEQITNIDKIWEQIYKIPPLSNHTTWETLGLSEPPKEPPFVSECKKATIHLMNVAEENIFPNQSTIRPVVKVPLEEFISNAKLLLVGVESSTFIYNLSKNFELKKDAALETISSETLRNFCKDLTHWGTCFRNLSDLIAVNPRTGKLHVEGLIFKALCSSVKEFLLFYHAAVLKVSTTENGKTIGPINFLMKVGLLGNLIVKVARLCRCDSQVSTSLDEGIGILMHIYKEVTKVTEQKVALVFYSILKGCCETYFRFLQQWIFEGVCMDIYDEFMITVKPKYVRSYGHRFWTKAFSVNEKSVPGFLTNLADSILQCGKSVMLLKMCDPQNPLCRVSASSQPPIRVCLSVGMLREQVKFYEEYTTKGQIAQGEEVSLSSAFHQQKEIEKKRAELVIAAQHDTLQRLKKEREDALRKVTMEKIELLEQLKEQAEEAALRKVRERDAELAADKIFLESVRKHEEEEKNLEKVERENRIKYYNELAEEATRRRIHADWRLRRIKLFDERLTAIVKMRREFADTPDDTEECFNIEEKRNEIKEMTEQWQKQLNEELNSKEPLETEDVEEADQENTSTEILVVSEIAETNVGEITSSQDENSNPTLVEAKDSSIKSETIDPLDKENQNVSATEQKDVERQSTPRATRPTVLDISGLNTQKHTNDRLDGPPDGENRNVISTLGLLKIGETDNMTQAQRNKLRVLQQEYGFTPNNNESSTILYAIENSEQSELMEIQKNRLRNTQHLTHLNWDKAESEKTLTTEVEGGANVEKTEIQLNRLRNTQHSNWEQAESEKILTKEVEGGANVEKTEIQLNRLRNTQHLNWEQTESEKILTKEVEGGANEEKTEIQLNRLRNTRHSNWEQTVSEKILTTEVEGGENAEKTEIQLNRLRNTQHLTDFNYNEPEVKESTEKLPLTEAEINRNKVMSHFYNRMDESEHFAPTRPENLTDWQKNRNRNMAHNVDHLDFDINRFPETDLQKETPMSTTTDHFGGSTHSGSVHVPSCENTPFSEINSNDMLLNRSSFSDTASSSDETKNKQSRITSVSAKLFPTTLAFPNLFGLGSTPGTPAANESQHQLTAEDVEMIDSTSLHVYLERSVLVPLHAQSRLVNSAIIKYLLNEHKMLSHLHSLRSYFFLLNGEFAKTLTQSLFTRLYEVSAPVELFNSFTLMNLLEKALVSSLSGTYANSELLSISVVEVPAYLQTSNPEILGCLSLNYKLSWPLNIIFNDVVMQQYSKVFKFLLMVGRVLWVLQEDFQILKIARKASISQNHHKLQLYRHSMMQFMNALHTYLTCGVLHASWSEFERELENAKTLDDVYDTHVRYIKKILSRCMLNVRQERMRACLCNIFKIVLKFHDRVRAQNWNAPAGPNYRDFERMFLAFCEQRQYLAHVAEKLASCNYQPHLMQFLHALNINHRYDLVPKK